MTERTTVRLPDELLVQAKRKALVEGRTLTSLIEEGLRNVVAAEKQPARVPPSMPPVSKAKGWLKPGIRDLKHAEELEDLEYAERLKRL
jgi:hypothetical protein